MCSLIARISGKSGNTYNNINNNNNRNIITGTTLSENLVSAAKDTESMIDRFKKRITSLTEQAKKTSLQAYISEMNNWKGLLCS